MKALLWLTALSLGALLLALILWGWQQGGLAILQLGVNLC